MKKPTTKVVYNIGQTTQLALEKLLQTTTAALTNAFLSPDEESYFLAYTIDEEFYMLRSRRQYLQMLKSFGVPH